MAVTAVSGAFTGDRFHLYDLLYSWEKDKSTAIGTVGRHHSSDAGGGRGDGDSSSPDRPGENDRWNAGCWPDAGTSQ